MQERKLNSENDIYLDDNGHFVRCKSFVESVSQRISSVLKSLKGEIFDSKNLGVDWIRLLGNDDVFLDYVVNNVKKVIQDIPDVESVENVKININGRNLEGVFNVSLTNGTSVEIEV